LIRIIAATLLLVACSSTAVLADGSNPRHPFVHHLIVPDRALVVRGDWIGCQAIEKSENPANL